MSEADVATSPDAPPNGVALCIRVPRRATIDLCDQSMRGGRAANKSLPLDHVLKIGARLLRLAQSNSSNLNGSFDHVIPREGEAFQLNSHYVTPKPHKLFF
jgi:hypothetical protein